MKSQGLASATDNMWRDLKVLTVLPPTNPDFSARLLRLVTTAGLRYGWKNSVLCPEISRTDIEKLLPPESIFIRPRMLQPASWESDRDRVAEVEQRIRQAETVARVPVGRIVAAAQSGVGRAYVVPARHRMSSSMSDLVLNDNTQPFRIIRRYFGFADEMLSACQPDLILAHEWGTAFHSTIWLAATARGIPMISVCRSKIHFDRTFWTADRLMLNDQAAVAAAIKQRANCPVSETARTYIQTFRDRPRISTYAENKWGKIGQKWRNSEIISWFLVPAKFARAVVVTMMHRWQGYDMAQHSRPIERVIAPRWRAYLARRHRRYMQRFDDDALRQMKYVYFPMHKETDLPLVHQATGWCDQKNTIQLIASCLPYDYKLLVREHRQNYGQRPTEYYEHLLRLPNVIVVDAFDTQFKYIQNADLIVTENGSSGWEGLLLRRKVVLLSKNFYDGTALGWRAYDPNQLSTTIVDALGDSPPVDPVTHDQRLGYMIDAELENSFLYDADWFEHGINPLSRILKDVMGSRVEGSGISEAQVRASAR